MVSGLFRDAKLADLLEQSPCILDERQLGPLVDKDPEWRDAAVFARDEVETIISDARIETRVTHSRKARTCSTATTAGCRGERTCCVQSSTWPPRS